MLPIINKQFLQQKQGELIEVLYEQSLSNRSHATKIKFLKSLQLLAAGLIILCFVFLLESQLIALCCFISAALIFGCSSLGSSYLNKQFKGKHLIHFKKTIIESYSNKVLYKSTASINPMTLISWMRIVPNKDYNCMAKDYVQYQHQQLFLESYYLELTSSDNLVKITDYQFQGFIIRIQGNRLTDFEQLIKTPEYKVYLHKIKSRLNIEELNTQILSHNNSLLLSATTQNHFFSFSSMKDRRFVPEKMLSTIYQDLEDLLSILLIN